MSNVYNEHYSKLFERIRILNKTNNINQILFIFWSKYLVTRES